MPQGKARRPNAEKLKRELSQIATYVLNQYRYVFYVCFASLCSIYVQPALFILWIGGARGIAIGGFFVVLVCFSAIRAHYAPRGRRFTSHYLCTVEEPCSIRSSASLYNSLSLSNVSSFVSHIPLPAASSKRRKTFLNASGFDCCNFFATSGSNA